jgi:hypothetical protein
MCVHPNGVNYTVRSGDEEVEKFAASTPAAIRKAKSSFDGIFPGIHEVVCDECGQVRSYE